MTDHELRRVLLVRELEEEGTFVAADKAREATRRSIPPQEVPETIDADVLAFLERRSELLSRSLPASAQMDQSGNQHWKTVTMVGVVVAFLLGFLINRLGDGGSGLFNILAPGVFGLLLWNFVVYLWSGIGLLRGRKGNWLTSWLRARRSKVSSKGDVVEDARARAESAFRMARSRPDEARARAVVHLCAAVVGIGVIAALLLGGLTKDYRAVWETTWLTEPQVAKFSELVYGMELPSDMRRDATGRGDGVPAGPWIARLLTLVALGVVLPRLGFALVTFLRLREARIAGMAGIGLLGYAQRAIRLASGKRESVAVVPYGKPLSAEVKAFLADVFAERWGGGAELVELSPVGMGEESEYPKTGEDFERTVAVFSFGSTAEAESHGVLPSRLETAGADDPLFLLLDAGRFHAQGAALPEFDKKSAERLQLWDHILWGERRVIAPFVIDRQTPRDFAAILAKAEKDGDLEGRLACLRA